MTETCAKCGHDKKEHHFYSKENNKKYGIVSHCKHGSYLKGIITILPCLCEKFIPQNHSPQDTDSKKSVTFQPEDTQNQELPEKINEFLDSIEDLDASDTKALEKLEKLRKEFISDKPFKKTNEDKLFQKARNLDKRIKILEKELKDKRKALEKANSFIRRFTPAFPSQINHINLSYMKELIDKELKKEHEKK